MSFFFFNDTATTEIYTLSLHDALPIYATGGIGGEPDSDGAGETRDGVPELVAHHELDRGRSEEHTSELQSPDHLVCRLLLEKKKKKINIMLIHNDIKINLRLDTLTVIR